MKPTPNGFPRFLKCPDEMRVMDAALQTQTAPATKIRSSSAIARAIRRSQAPKLEHSIRPYRPKEELNPIENAKAIL